MHSVLFPYLKATTQSGRHHLSMNRETGRPGDTDRFITVAHEYGSVCGGVCVSFWRGVLSCVQTCVCESETGWRESSSTKCVTVSVPLIVQLYCSGTRKDSSVSLGDN